MKRFGVSLKISSGIGIIVAVTLVAGVTTLFTLQSLRDGYQHISRLEVPGLVESGKMMATMRMLEALGVEMAASSRVMEVEQLHNRTRDLTLIMFASIDTLGGLYEQDGKHEDSADHLKPLQTIRSQLDQLDNNFNRLRKVVVNRIEAEHHFHMSFHTMLEQQDRNRDLTALWHQENHAEHTESGEQWLAKQYEILSLLNGLHMVGSLPRLRHVEQQIAVLTAVSERQYRRLEPTEQGDLAPIHQAIHRATSAIDGPLQTRHALLSFTNSQRGILNANHQITAQLVSQVVDIFESKQHQIEEDNLGFDRLASDRSSLMVLLSITSLAVALLIVGYLHQSVLKRLHALKERMLNAVRETAPGNDGQRAGTGDEITEIGNVLDHFYSQIGEREQSLRKARDEAEQLAVRAEAANRAKSTFLANMSHELRTPLNAIIGFSEIIKSGMRKGAEEEYANDIHQSGTHLLNLINGILELSKIEAGKHDLDHELVDIREITHDIQRFFSIPLQEKGLTISSNFDDNSVIHADEMAVKQILVNLISNAVKFTDRSGGIRIHGRREEPFYCIQVVDDGVGIAKSELERVFEPFHQEKGGYVDKAEGTGLGLTIVRNLVELHGGRLHLESVKGEGTIVTVHLPVGPELPAA